MWLVHGTHPNWFFRSMFRPVMRWARPRILARPVRARRLTLGARFWRFVRNEVRGLYRSRRRLSNRFTRRGWIPSEVLERVAVAEPRFAWVRRGGVLRTALVNDPRFRTVVRVFRWSGDNSHTARIEWGRKLACAINDDAEGGPGTQHYLIGHSHGGNVIAYALDQVVAGRVAGVVTIGTPFVSCAPRRLTVDAAALAPIPMLTMALTWILGTATLLGGVSGDGLVAWARVAGAGVLQLITVVAIPVLAFWSERIWRVVLARGETHEARILKQLGLPVVSVPLLCIKTAHDEAGDGLGAAGVLADAMFALVGTLRRAIPWAAATLAAAMLYHQVIRALSVAPPRWLNSIVLWGGRSAASLIVGWWLYLILAATMALLVRRVVFGGESFLGALLVRVTSSPVPDNASILQVRTAAMTELEGARSSAKKQRRVGWTRHSAICELEGTCAAVTTWIA